MNHETTSPLKNTIYASITGRLGYKTLEAGVAVTTTVTTTTTGTPARTRVFVGGLTTSTRTTTANGTATKFVTTGTTTVGVTPTASAAVTKFFTAGAVTVTTARTANSQIYWRKFWQPDAVLVMTGMSGAVGDIQDSPTSPDGNAIVPTGGASNVRISFENPADPLRTNTNDQTIRVLVTAV